MNNTLEFQFLKEVSQVLKYYNQQRELSGENFNIFSIMAMEHDEVFTHSAIIAELLNPKGTHSLGTKPLELFYKMVLQEDYKLDIEKMQCYKEEYIGFINEDKTEGGRLDIVVKNCQEEGFVIENKIYATEQINQLSRYKNRYPNAKILYLTLDGVESKQLTSTDGVEYFPISYKEDITYWIEECLKLSYNKPILRETLKQYLYLIKKLTNQSTSKEMSEKITDIINENFEASAEIYQNFEKALRLKQFDFLGKIKYNIENSNNASFNVELVKNDAKDILEIYIPNGYIVNFRIKNLNAPLILVGKKDVKSEDEILSKINASSSIKLRKADWKTCQWQYFNHCWSELGTPQILIEAFNNGTTEKIAEALLNIANCTSKL